MKKFNTNFYKEDPVLKQDHETADSEIWLCDERVPHKPGFVLPLYEHQASILVHIEDHLLVIIIILSR